MQARVDECLLNDVRFRAIVKSYRADPANEGCLSDEDCEDLALARCVRAYWLAQKYWRDDRKLIPAKIWDMANLASLVTYELAEVRDEGIYVRGAAVFFDWFHEKAEAGRSGGIASGKARRNNGIKARAAKQRSTASEARTCTVSVLSCSDSVSVLETTTAVSPPPLTLTESAPAEEPKKVVYKFDLTEMKAATWFQRQIKLIHPGARCGPSSKQSAKAGVIDEPRTQPPPMPLLWLRPH